MPCEPGSRSSTILQRSGKIGLGAAERRRQAEKDSREDSDDHGEKQYAVVYAHVCFGWQHVRREPQFDSAHQCAAQRKARHATEDSEKYVFRKQLPDQPETAGAQGSTDSDLMFAGRTPPARQIGEGGAPDTRRDN